ncbi:MAG: molybdenum cofactor biosynthesis protein MoaE [Pseudohongiellaceae bacterium]
MISIQTEDFSLADEYAAIRRQAGDAGAIVTFTGLVRESYRDSAQGASEGAVQSLFLEHYPGMTEKCLNEIQQQACEKWPLLASRIIHRVGELQSHDQIVFVATASHHRQAAFEAAEFMMDYLKSRAPFWKKQVTDAASSWIESRASDQAAIERWQKS